MKTMKSARCLLLTLALAFSLGACAAQEQEPTVPETQPSTEPSTAASDPQTEPAEESYEPVTITTYDYEGNEITTTYDKVPERVLCVYQGCI